MAYGIFDGAELPPLTPPLREEEEDADTAVAPKITHVGRL